MKADIEYRIGKMARESGTCRDFKERLKAFLENDGDIVNLPAKANLLRLLEHDGREILELPTESKIRLRTFELLWLSLRGAEAVVSKHFLTDMSKQFEALYERPGAEPGIDAVRKWMDRWPGGLDRHIVEARKRNKERIISRLVERIGRRRDPKSRYVFAEGMDEGQKRRMVEGWWNDHRFHLAMAVRSPRELDRMLGGKLPEPTKELYRQAARKGIPIFVTPYYISLLDLEGGNFDDSTIRSYVLYSKDLVEAFGNIKAWEREDRVEPGKPNAAGWLLPEGGNIHRRYPEVVILIPDSVGRSCGGLCASCQRMYDFQGGRLNFNLKDLLPKESWRDKLLHLMRYIEHDMQVRDILITGGDALMSQNQTLRNLFDSILKMAIRKREANLRRPDGRKYAEIERIRLGTRLPAYLPMRITDELAGILEAFKKKGSEAGIRQFFIQTHFQSPLEITPEAKEAVLRLRSAGWEVTNQLVFNVAASRRGHTAQLRRCLEELGVHPYYTFTVKGFSENHALFVPNSRSVQESCEEKHLEGLPFTPSDRNVLNLPGIGKSMTFRLVGIMPDGRRVLCFEHDKTRRHSPVIGKYPKIHILENKSIGEYLEQLAAMGEDPASYGTVWHYVESRTEKRFPLFEYVGSGSGTTDEINHFAPLGTSLP